MITPFSQIVGTQAVLNVVRGERYRIVPDEVKKYALGYYGKLLAPVQPDVLDRIVENGSPHIPLTPPPLEPAVPALRRKYPNMSDEERLLRYSYAGSQVDEMLATGPVRTEYVFQHPIVRLLEELSRRPRIRHVRLETKGYRVELSGA
jgi:oxaloacetate decarboxylase alpha subunit